MFQGDGFESEYPTKESRPTSAGFGYASDMMALAVNRDDAAAFMFFLDQCGGPDCEVLISGSVLNYAATHGAERCVKALIAAGSKSDFPPEYWLKKAQTPCYGPNANRFQ